MAGPLLAVALLAIAIGAWVVVREKGRQVSLSFFASTAAFAVYFFGFAFMARESDPAAALRWGRIAYLGIPFIVPSIYHFSVDLLGLGRTRGRVVRAAWIIGVLYAILAVSTDVLIEGVRMTRLGYITDLTWRNLPFLLWSWTLLVVVTRDYWAEYRQADAIQRARIRWLAIPLVVASLGFIDYAPSFGIPILPVGFVFVPVFLISAAWAVERYHFPDLTPAFAADHIVATMADALLVCATNGRIAATNAAAARLLGYRENDLRGLQLSAVLGPHQADSILRNTVTEREAMLHTRAGARVAASISTSHLRDRSGRILGTVVVARDIRERRRAALEIERREQRFRALTENALDTITILNSEGIVLYQSPAVRRLGYEPDDDLGMNIFERAHPEDLPRLVETFKRLVAQPDATVEAEARFRHADGHYRVFELRGRNLLDNPAVNGIVVNGRDITEERQLGEQLQQAQKMEAIGRLAGGVAHDFNNILTAIQGNVTLLREEVGDDSPLAPELDEVRRGAERAARLTDQLLAFSRRQVVRPSVLDLNAVVTELRSMLERLIGEDIRMETKLAEAGPVVRADRGHIEQVVLNLVVNARDAVGSGGRIEIETGVVTLDDESAAATDAGTPPGTYAVLAVSDDGHGMDAGTRSRIFEPFFTTKAQGKGTGLGLSTAYGTIRQAGGYIAVHSDPGCGTRFAVYLPLVEDGSVPDETERTPPPVALPDPGEGPGATVLVVEDETPVRALMKKILVRRGYAVLEAEDGAAALDLMAGYSGPVDLLITDLVMPGLGGRELAERLTRERPSLRTIFVSGYTADDVIRRGVVSGEHVFLGKPFSPDELLVCVADVLKEATRA